MKIWGWRRINRNFYTFQNKIDAKIKRISKHYWRVEIKDYFFDKYNTFNEFRRWTEAYNYVCDKMREISNDIRRSI